MLSGPNTYGWNDRKQSGCWHQRPWLLLLCWLFHQHQPPVKIGEKGAWREAVWWYNKCRQSEGKNTELKIYLYFFFLDLSGTETSRKIRGYDSLRRTTTIYISQDGVSQGTWGRLTRAPSSLKIAEDPMRSDGTIFLLHRRRRNVSEERSFLWNFQPMREEYSQPSTGSRLCRRKKKGSVNFLVFFYPASLFLLTCAGTVWSDIFFRGLISLFLRWTWYIFSAATQDLGLSSGGMVIPYSQPGREGINKIGPWDLGKKEDINRFRRTF